MKNIKKMKRIQKNKLLVRITLGIMVANLIFNIIAFKYFPTFWNSPDGISVDGEAYSNLLWIVSIIILAISTLERVDIYEELSLQNELNLLKSQLNPHFIFNSLSSLQNLIGLGENDKAVSYLGDFSSLLRKILNYSSLQFVSLKQEIEFLKLYTDIETLRFEDKFLVEINVDPKIDAELINITPLLLQPIIENAIGHGLMHREEGGKLAIDFKLNNKILVCTVIDNGIGIAQAKKIKEESGNINQSKGTALIEDRIKILNRLDINKKNKNKYDIITAVAFDDSNFPGTKVTVLIPVF